MNKYLFPFLGIFALPACDYIAVGAALTTVAAAPVWVPIEYANSQNNVVQPVNVVSASGKPIGPNFAQNAEATFTVTKETISCAGEANVRDVSFLGSAEEINFSCGKGLAGKLSFDKVTTRIVNVSIGPVIVRDPATGAVSQATMKCKCTFNVGKKRVDPFMLRCPRDSKAVFVPGNKGPDKAQFSIWFTPPV
jgi:hypothetical protein